MSPLVSVIIPTYNRARMLVQAIDSVLAQEYCDFELIIVDDGSTDHTVQAVQKYQNKLSYYYQVNQGVSKARNYGAQLARGRFICFLDSDDLWQPGKLSAQAAFMNAHPYVPLCHTEEIWVRNNVRVNPHKKHRKYSGWMFEHCLPRCVISPSSVILKRDFLIQTGGFDETLPACEDYDLWLRITKDHPVEFIDRPLVVKRGGHPDQLSHKYWGNDRFRAKSLKKLLESGNLTTHQRQLVEHYLLTKCRILARGCFKRGKFAEGKKYLAIPAGLVKSQKTPSLVIPAQAGI